MSPKVKKIVIVAIILVIIIAVVLVYRKKKSEADAKKLAAKPKTVILTKPGRPSVEATVVNTNPTPAPVPTA